MNNFWIATKIDKHFPVYLKIMFIINYIQVFSLHEFQYIGGSIVKNAMLNGSQFSM